MANSAVFATPIKALGAKVAFLKVSEIDWIEALTTMRACTQGREHIRRGSGRWRPSLQKYVYVMASLSSSLRNRHTSDTLRLSSELGCPVRGRKTTDRPSAGRSRGEPFAASVTTFAVLSSILSLSCTTDELPGYCPDGHLVVLRPCLWALCGLAQCRCNP